MAAGEMTRREPRRRQRGRWPGGEITGTHRAKYGARAEGDSVPTAPAPSVANSLFQGSNDDIAAWYIRRLR